MRYYNENPQVTWLREENRQLTKDYQFAKEYNRILVDVHNEMMLKIQKFNSLPWYKKMFYKFNI